MHETDLHLEPNEASDLSPVFSSEVLADRGWDRALVTVLDEAAAEDAIAVLVHEAGAGEGEGWTAIRVRATPSHRKGSTEDAEACATRDGWLYVVGSQFGGKDGPLEASRSFLARAREDDVAAALDGETAALDIAWLRFGVHRAVNDALAAAAIDPIALGPKARECFIDATIRAGAEGDKRWSGRVKSADHPINVEAAAFRGDGRMLLGLRYPTTRDGHPILVELVDVDAVFADPDAVPTCGNVWFLETAGSPDEPVGFRGLHADGPDAFQALVGNLDSAGKGAVILADRPEAGRACSEHVRFELPLAAGGGAVASESVRRFETLKRVEGIVTDSDGTAYYVIDEEGRVALRTLLVED